MSENVVLLTQNEKYLSATGADKFHAAGYFRHQHYHGGNPWHDDLRGRHDQFPAGDHSEKEDRTAGNSVLRRRGSVSGGPLRQAAWQQHHHPDFVLLLHWHNSVHGRPRRPK